MQSVFLAQPLIMSITLKPALNYFLSLVYLMNCSKKWFSAILISVKMSTY